MTDGPIRIFIPLEDEGTDVWRPVDAFRIEGDTYRIAVVSVPDDEEWSFRPGDVVRVEQRMLSGGPSLVAVASAQVTLPTVLVVAVALIDPDGRVLIAQRPEGKQLAGLWEFPGGKVDPGERPEAALIRELKEELDIDVNEACLAPFVFASHAYDSFHLLMPLYLCRRWSGVVQNREHAALKWVRPNQLSDYPMPPADEPLVAWLRDLL